MQLVSFFRLHLMLHARIVRFDVMTTVSLFWETFLELPHKMTSITLSLISERFRGTKLTYTQGRSPVITPRETAIIEQCQVTQQRLIN